MVMGLSFLSATSWCLFYGSFLLPFFFFSSRRRHTRWTGDWSSDVCSSDLLPTASTLDGFIASAAGRHLVCRPSQPEEESCAPHPSPPNSSARQRPRRPQLRLNRSWSRPGRHRPPADPWRGKSSAGPEHKEGHLDEQHRNRQSHLQGRHVDRIRAGGHWPGGDLGGCRRELPRVQSYAAVGRSALAALHGLHL